MPGYNFAERKDIERVLEMVHAPVPRQLLEDQRTFPQEYVTESFIVKTPARGIPASVSGVAGKGECTPYYLRVSDENVIQYTDNSAAAQTYTVFNISPFPIHPAIYIKVHRVFGELIAEEPFGSYLLMTPASGIPARSGTTAGSADCTPYYVDASNGAIYEWLDASLASQSFKVLNVSASAVAGSKYIQAKIVKDALLVDMEDCG